MLAVFAHDAAAAISDYVRLGVGGSQTDLSGYGAGWSADCGLGMDFSAGGNLGFEFTWGYMGLENPGTSYNDALMTLEVSALYRFSHRGRTDVYARLGVDYWAFGDILDVTTFSPAAEKGFGIAGGLGAQTRFSSNNALRIEGQSYTGPSSAVFSKLELSWVHYY
jgi:opacity protein-like surface antigen